MNKVTKFIANPFIVFRQPGVLNHMKWISDEAYLRLVYHAYTGERLNLDDPRTFNEKLQWIKLHDRNPLYTTLVDKYRVKPWVADRIGAEHVTKTYAMWERAEDIDISELPERFVLKTNHDCGGVVICRDRAKFDLIEAKKKLADHLKTNYYWRTREWPYRDVEPCVFAEEYLDPSDGVGECCGESCPADYKVSCFAGEPRLIEVHKGRSTDHTCDYYTPDWHPLPDIEWAGLPKSADGSAMPDCLDEILKFSSTLTKDFPHIRADWYVVGDRLMFGELTLFNDAGFGSMDKNTAMMMGSWIDLDRAYGPLCHV